MKPISITFHAIGPYKDTVTIDFEKLYQHHLFLITGPTGSGKTTIFDGITFALFGTASGEDRESDSLKSHHADINDMAYVAFSFSIRDEHYHIKRYPKQEYMNRKNAISNKSQEVELHLPNDKVITKIKEVDDYIVELFGLNANQFKQLLMLPQGEFRKLLHSTSREREEIFRNIFKTDMFNMFQKKLKSKYDESKVSVAKTRTELETYLKQIDIEMDFPKTIEHSEEILSFIKNYLAQINKEIESKNKELNKLQTIINKQNSQKDNQLLREQLVVSLTNRNKVKEELLSKENEINKISNELKRLKNVEKLSPLFNELDSININITNLENDLKKSKDIFKSNNEQLENVSQTFSINQKEYVKRDSMIKEISLLNEELKKVESYQLLKGRKDSLLKTIQSINLKITENKKKEQSLNEEIIELTKIANKKESLIEKKNELIAHRKELSNSLENNSSNFRILKTIITDEVKLKQIEEKLLKHNKEVKSLEKESLQIEMKYHLNMASILADTLKENQPCPVCGSISHPMPTRATSSISKEDIKKAQKVLGLAKDKKNALNVEIESLKAMISTQKRLLKHDIDELSTDLLTESLTNVRDNIVNTQVGVEKELENVNENIKNVNKAVENLEKANNSLKLITSKIVDDEKEISKMTASLIEIENQLSNVSYSTTPIDLKSIIVDKKKVLNTLDKVNESITKQMKELNDQKLKLEERMKSLENQLSKQSDLFKLKSDTLKSELNMYKLSHEESSQLLKELKQIDVFESDIKKYNEAVLTINTEIKEIKVQLNKFEEIDLEKLKVSLEENKFKFNSIQNETQNQDYVMKKLNDLYEKYFTLYSQFEDVIKNHEMVRHLSEIADGKNQSKLSFERYILTHYFDEIIYYANLRLIEMTDSRYSLIRRVDVGRGASGLELDVFDQHTSKKRSVKSLSGGESFKASLSLALGLAEIVQNYSGGISLETMFIDEGFGTLDPESLDSAIETLLKLEKSNRKVGVISHVSELKKRIPAKINIIPNQEGSTIKLEY